jgi:DNA-binding transcriptional LysR family regulator
LRVLAELDLAEESLAEGHGEVSGRVRITMPGQLGRHCIAPKLFALAQRHPRLQLNLSFTDNRVDLIEEGYDLAIRSGALPDSHDYQMRSLGMQRMVLCAARSYLDHSGSPTGLTDLANVDAIIYGRGQTFARWRFERQGGDESVIEVQARICMDDLASMLDAVRAGLGIARLPVWLVHAELAAGTIVQILAEEQAVSYPLHLLWPASRQYSHRLRIVIDELATSLPALLNGGS